ncbi:MAG TPA: lysylphosphatidylglycerol synthase domain-containing protein [Myxococcota bacterium]|nr:lysylphosphatidylglycerol synthase domain-containing protein [Myxococcota bacterium]
MAKRWRSVLPWVISAALLFYVFGYATNWARLIAALEDADVPRFLLFAAADRLAFFTAWAWLSASALRRFVANVPIASVLAIRGGSELARAVSNPLADAAYALGLMQLCGGRLDAVIASALIPGICHYFVMLVQMTIALPLQRAEADGSVLTSIAVTACVMWAVLATGVASIALVRAGRLRSKRLAVVAQWLERFPPRQIAPFLVGFAALSIFDVQIQWLASRAFGVALDWSALAARLPLVYLAFVIPTLGNFGTRELTWAALFGEFGERDALIAYAFAVNAIFLVINVLLGVLFLSRALQLIGAVRRARREGESIPGPLLRDPTDP